MRAKTRIKSTLIGLLLCGLAWVPAGPVRADNGAPSRAELVTGSARLEGRVELGPARFRKAGVLTRAQVRVRNLTETRFTLEYKVDWRDADGFEVTTARSWHRFTLTPHQTRSFSSVGKTPEATSIVFTVRLPDDFFIEDDRRAAEAIHDQQPQETEDTTDEAPLYY